MQSLLFYVMFTFFTLNLNINNSSRYVGHDAYASSLSNLTEADARVRTDPLSLSIINV